MITQNAWSVERVGKTKTTALQQKQLIIYIPYVYEQRATTTTRAIATNERSKSEMQENL